MEQSLVEMQRIKSFKSGLRCSRNRMKQSLILTHMRIQYILSYGVYPYSSRQPATGGLF